MAKRSRLEFDHEDRRRIYTYVERHGAVKQDRIANAVDIDETAVRHHVAILRRDGLLEEVEGTLRINVERATGEQTVSSDGIAYTIRAARQEDLSGIVGAIRQVVSAGSYVEAESVAELLDHEEVLLRFNDIESRMFFVATVDDAVIGWVHLRGSELEKLGHTATLTVGVLDEYRGRGIGGDLLRRGLEWASAEGYERIYQSVPATNESAITFLEHHGWSVEAIREGHYRIDGAPVDEVMMATEVVTE